MEYIPAKTIVTKSKDSRWFGIDYNMNIYRGCSHGCIYCDSRSDCYRIKNFDQVCAKENALQIIRDDLRRKVKTGVVGTGAMSDPYNPYEKELNLTRHSLELIDAFGFGISIATKSVLLERDIDILTSIASHSPVLCKITITTSDDHMASKVEPGAPVSSERFHLISQLSSAGLFAGVLLMPVLPFIEDNEENIRSIVKQAYEAGAKFIYPAFGVTLRANQREWFFVRLRDLFPNEHLVERYIKQYKNYYQCTSPNASKLWKTFVCDCKQYGILYDMKDIIHAYKRNYHMTQLSLFD